MGLHFENTVFKAYEKVYNDVSEQFKGSAISLIDAVLKAMPTVNYKAEFSAVDEYMKIPTIHYCGDLSVVECVRFDEYGFMVVDLDSDNGDSSVDINLISTEDCKIIAEAVYKFYDERLYECVLKQK